MAGMSVRGWVLFAAMSLIWGIPYLLIKVAVEGVSVPVLVLARTAVGARSASSITSAPASGGLRPGLTQADAAARLAITEAAARARVSRGLRALGGALDLDTITEAVRA